MTQFNTAKYKVVFESKVLKGNNGQPLKFYALKEITDYHLSRNIAANAQNIYSESGLTKSMLSVLNSSTLFLMFSVYDATIGQL